MRSWKEFAVTFTDGRGTVISCVGGVEGGDEVEAVGCAEGAGDGLSGNPTRRESNASLEAVVPPTSETSPESIAASIY